MSTINIIGPGISSLDYKTTSEGKTLAFQEVFPNCIEHLSLVPDYWTFADPNGSILGLKYLVDNIEQAQKFKNMNILVPDVFFKEMWEYRMYFGTTPLMKKKDGWSIFQDLLAEVSRHYNVTKVPITTIKYIQLHEKNTSELKQIFQHDYIRFMSEKVVFGTVEYDSEIVIGDIHKWGLENKLTLSVFPICYYLKAQKAVVYGFDYAGPRFYDSNTRHSWSNLEGKIDHRVEYSLSLINKWLQWQDIHGINIVSGTSRDICLANRYLEH
jgi:hypothetical protein